jgi:hypothetical protein
MTKNSTIILSAILIFTAHCRSDKWVKIKLDDYNCTFALPFDSYKKTERVFFIEGIGKINCHEITINTENTSDPNDGYEFNCFEYPQFNFYANDTIIDTFYSGTIKNVLVGYNATKITEEIIEYNGNPGRELYFSISNGQLYGFWRSFIINNKQYSLIVFTKESRLFNSSTLRFLNSFKMIK